MRPGLSSWWPAYACATAKPKRRSTQVKIVCRIQCVLTCWVFDPRQVLAEAVPQVVVPAGGDRLARRVPQQALAGVQAAPAFRVREQVGHQRRRDRLPALRPALLVQPDQALLGVEIFRGERQRPAASAGCLGVQPDDQRVKGRVVAGGSRHGADLALSRLSGRAMRALRSLRGLGTRAAGFSASDRKPIGDCVVVHAPQGADQVLGGAASAAGVPARERRSP